MCGKRIVNVTTVAVQRYYTIFECAMSNTRNRYQKTGRTMSRGSCFRHRVLLLLLLCIFLSSPSRHDPEKRVKTLTVSHLAVRSVPSISGVSFRAHRKRTKIHMNPLFRHGHFWRVAHAERTTDVFTILPEPETCQIYTGRFENGFISFLSNKLSCTCVYCV